MNDALIPRSEIVRVARSYRRTPYGHMGRQPGLVLDCAGVVICVARELEIVSPTFDVPPYTLNPDGTILRWCDEYMTRTDELEDGNVIVVAIDEDPQHMGIIAHTKIGDRSIIHAASKRTPNGLRGLTLEVNLVFNEQMKFVAAYNMPGVG